MGYVELFMQKPAYSAPQFIRLAYREVFKQVNMSLEMDLLIVQAPCMYMMYIAVSFSM